MSTACTYIPGTPVYGVRFLIADTDVETEPMFTDAEILHALVSNDENRFFAGAELLSAAATDAARCAVIAKTSTTTTDPTKISELLGARAADLRGQGGFDALTALLGGSGRLRVPDQVFSTDANGGTDLGTMGGW
ncbi:MAG: hypothetical protein H8F28_19845 [Fibrella sp.]|nr:hypothetical protein [Armatimonadota bacterium]